MAEPVDDAGDARPGSDPAVRDLWDTDVVRRNFRSVLSWIVALTGLSTFLHMVVLLRLNDPHWVVPLAVMLVCLLVSRTTRPSDSFARFIAGLLVFVGITSWAMSVLVLAFGRDSGFHFPFLIGLPLIAISGRIGFASKALLSIAYVGALLMLDRMSASIPVAMTLGSGLGGVVRLLNIGFVAIAISGMMLRYFWIVVRQKAELVRLSTTDPMTGLLNRRHLIEIVEAPAASTNRSARPLSLAIFDIDDFKRINDRYGHEAGDAVIRHVAGVISASFRSGDALGRWGGEEFVALLPGTKREDALAIAERVRSEVASSAARVDRVSLRVTVTAGVATLCGDESFDDALRRADAALYVGKTTGKNRVVDADPHAGGAGVVIGAD